MQRQNSSFFNFTPEQLLQATEAAGFSPTGEFRQLNSYENRVFDLGLESKERIICKVYRPQRWTRDCIQEEHDFLLELHSQGFPCVPPLRLKSISTRRWTLASSEFQTGLPQGIPAVDQEKSPVLPSLISFQGLWMSFFPKKLGRMPDELRPADLPQIGRRIAELHILGAQDVFHQRPRWGSDVQSNLDENMERISPELKPRYREVAFALADRIQELGEISPSIRLHGDLHRGNLLNDGREFFFVDFDDCMQGPPFQDLWMLWLALDAEERSILQEAYDEFFEFPVDSIEDLPIFQAQRLISYSAWISRRWSDPSFPALFPQFGTFNYWAEEVEALEKCWQSIQRRS